LRLAFSPRTVGRTRNSYTFPEMRKGTETALVHTALVEEGRDAQRARLRGHIGPKSVRAFRSEARSESVLTIAQAILRQQYLSQWIACT
jgi:hypothetical protein